MSDWKDWRNPDYVFAKCQWLAKKIEDEVVGDPWNSGKYWKSGAAWLGVWTELMSPYEIMLAVAEQAAAGKIKPEAFDAMRAAVRREGERGAVRLEQITAEIEAARGSGTGAEETKP